MTPIYKFRFIILPVLIVLILTSGCEKSEEDEIVSEYNITCYTATYSQGIYKSDNGGTSWYPIDVDQEDLYLYYKRLYLHPGNNELYIATTGEGIFIFDPQAKTINSITQFKDENIRSIAFRLNSPNRKAIEVLAGMRSRGVYIKEPESENWQASNNGLTYRDVNTLLVRDQDLYAGTIRDLFKWNESLDVWKVASEGIKNKNIISMDADPKGDIIYAGSGVYEYNYLKGFFEDVPCLYKSVDKGQTWEASDSGLPDDTLVYVIAVNPENPEMIYIGTSDGIYRSINSGEKWEKMEEGLPEEYRVFDIDIARTLDGKDVVYATGSKGVYMTTDEKDPIWMNKSYGLPSTNVTSIALSN